MTGPDRVSPRALDYPHFRNYVAAKFLTTIAVQMQSVAVGWQVYSITKDPLDLGLIGLAQFLPFVLLTLPAGQIADRLNRKLILTLCYAVETLCGVLLLLYTLRGIQEVWPVFAILVIFGSARAFSVPASQAITPNLVPTPAFSNAVALNSSFGQIANIAGPAAGGVIYLLGPTTVYATVSIILTVSVLNMMRINLPKIIRAPEPANWHTVFEGLRFVRSRPIVLGAISLDLFAVLFGGATALLPAYASDILHIGPQGLGLLRAAPAIGAAVTGLVIAYHPVTRHVGRWLFSSVSIFGLSIIVFGISENFMLSLMTLIVLGSADMVSVYIRHMLVQLETPDAIRGRVSAVNGVFIGASNELGEFESGIAAAGLGLVPSVVLGGVATLIVTGLWMRWFPALRFLQKFPDHASKQQ